LGQILLDSEVNFLPAYRDNQYPRGDFMRKIAIGHAVLLAGTMLSSTVALAQEAATEPNDAQVEDIVVTAQRRSENIQDVPISITAITSETLRDAGSFSSTEIAQSVPNLTVSTTYVGSAPRFFIRGVGLGDFNASSTGGVGLYVDDVFLGSPNLLTFALFDLDRVEVLRGPQGTLYGRNTTGGAIRFESARPTNDLSGYATARYGRFSELRLEGAVSGPVLGDTVRARVAGLYTSRDGTLFNRFTNRRENESEAWALRGIIEADITENLEASINVHGGRATPDTTRFQHRGIIDPATGGLCGLNAILAFQCVDVLGYRDTDNDLFAGDYNNAGKERVSTFGVTGRLVLDGGPVTVTSITAYDWVRRVAVEDVDASPNNLVDATWNQPSRQFSQELRFASNDGGNFNWIVGGYYLRDSRDAVNRFRVLPDFPVASSFEARQSYSQVTQALAVFGQADYRLTDALKVTVGLRYTAEDTDYTELAQFEAAGASPLVPPIPFLSVNDSVNSERVTARFALDYQVNDDVLLYASYNRGYKAGGFNGGFATSLAQKAPFQPETLNAYEIGLKTDLFDRRVRFNVAGFYYDYSDLQVFTLRQAGGIPAQILENAANAEVYGLEAELTIVPTAGLQFDAGLGLLHTSLKDFVTLDPATLLPRDLSGNRSRNAPELTFNAGVTYDTALSDTLALGFNLNARYQSSVFFDVDNNPRLTQGGYWLANGRVSLGHPEDNWRVSLFAENLFNQRYYREVANLGDFGLDEIAVGDPRTYGVELSVRF
jgi:iron complex outermembrane recepter protein